MEEKKLLRLLEQDPAKGLEAAVREYAAYVYKIAHTRLSDVCRKEDIEEAVSDIFVKFWQSGQRSGFRIRSVKAYLAVIAERHCIDVFRKACRTSDSVDYDTLENLISDGSPYSDIELADAIKRLGEPDSIILIRRFFFGQRSEDIGRELGMKTNTVNKRVSRGLEKLRKMLEEDM